MKHTLSVLVENKPGVLARIAGLFSRRGFNIETLAVGPTEKPDFSRMTLVVEAKSHQLEQVTKQLHKLINVVKISDLNPQESIGRELVLIKITADAGTRAQIMEIVDIFRAKIVDVAKETLIIEATGTEDKIKALEDLLKPHGIRELVRSGRVSLARGIKVAD
ncbi:MAG TPA: acetolactate synthase small subunit [Candidatus Subteraquimicrobiales bacterium]